MSSESGISRRDFLRFRRTQRGKVLEVSCRAMYMRCADAALVADRTADWDPSLGEPPAVFERRSADAIVAALAEELRDAQVLRLHEPEWMADMTGAVGLGAVIAAFRARGGIVERVETAAP